MLLPPNTEEFVHYSKDKITSKILAFCESRFTGKPGARIEDGGWLEGKGIEVSKNWKSSEKRRAGNSRAERVVTKKWWQQKLESAVKETDEMI